MHVDITSVCKTFAFAITNSFIVDGAIIKRHINHRSDVRHRMQTLLIERNFVNHEETDVTIKNIEKTHGSAHDADKLSSAFRSHQTKEQKLPFSKRTPSLTCSNNLCIKPL